MNLRYIHIFTISMFLRYINSLGWAGELMFVAMATNYHSRFGRNLTLRIFSCTTTRKSFGMMIFKHARHS
jgi:hypothetical protein